MTEDKPAYKDLEQRILFLERELHDKEERLLQLQEEARERERNMQDIKSNFETFFNTNDDFLFVLDEQGNIVHCNSVVEKRLGYTLNELRGKSILSVHPQEQRSEAAKVTADAMAGKLASFQIPLVSKQGKQIYVETSASSGVWNGKPAIFGVSKDITRLKLSEEKYSTVFYLTPFACALSEASSGRYIEVNDAFCKLFSYTREEIIGHTAVELQIIPTETRDEILSKTDQLGRIYNIAIELKTKNGEVKRVLFSGRDVYIQDNIYRYAIVHDVTEIHKAKQIAEENERKFSIAFHSSPSVSMITRIDTGEILEANDAVEQFAGFSKAEIIGNSVYNLNLWAIDGARSKFIELLTRDKKVLNFESTFRKKSGEAFIGLISGQMIQVQNQNCILSIIYDITDFRRTESELIRAKEIAEENEQRFSMLLNACPEPLSVTTIEDGRFIITNEAFHKASGFDREDILNHNSMELNTWLSIEDRQRWVNELVKTGSIRGAEIQLRTRRGIRDYLLSSDIIEFDKKKCSLNFYIDITDRKTAELELLKAKEKAEESESKFKNLYEALSISYLILKDGVCTDCNEATLGIYGADSKDEVLGKSPLDFSPEFQLNNLRTSEEAYRQIQTTIEKGSHAFEWIALRNNKKEEFFAEISLKKFYYKGELYLQCLTTDITERKRIEAELIAAKERAEKNERALLVQNQEYEIVNEELRQTNDELIAAKEKIEESEQKFKNLYESLSIAYLIIKDGVCVDCNKAALAIYGVEDKDEIIGKSPIVFSPEFQPNNLKSSDEAIRNTQIAFEKGIHTFEWLAMRKNKETFINEVSLKPFHFRNELYFQCLTTEITERKKYESEIIAAKNRAEEIKVLLQNIADNMPAFIAAVDAETLQYKFVNNQYAKSFGKAKNEIIGSHISEIMGQKNYEFALEYINKIKQGQPSSYINTFDLAEGRRYLSVNYVQGYNEKGEFDKIIVLTYDVTELKNAEFELIKAKEKVEESEQKFSSAFHNNPSIITITNVIDGRIIEVNEGVYRIGGYKPEELIGKSPAELELWTIGEDRIKYRDLLSETKRVLNFETTFRKKSGEKFIGLISGEVIQLNNLNYVLSIINDITELKNTEFELIKAKEKAEESDHLKTAFLQNVSHEIRTPLNAICGFSEILSNEDLSVDKRKSFVQIIQNSSNQLLSIVNDVLAISSLETKQAKINLSAVCLNTIIVELLAIFKQQAKDRNITLYTTHQLTDKQSEVYSDKTKITQILSNLLSNALKFTHTGSIEFGYRLIDNEIEFYVKDSGIGIKPELHEKIFERFRQADSTIQTNYGGTGLGLSICKGFVELLGGKIWAESEIGKGSTFYFTLPYKPVNEIYDITSPGKQSSNFRTVMVAEDDEYNYLFIEELLGHFELKLIHAKNGEEAVEVFKSNPQIDLIFMDIKMPVMDGYNAAKIIKSAKPDLPIVAQTAYAMEYERVKYEGVFDDYLTKPIKGELLTEMISKFLAVKR